MAEASFAGLLAKIAAPQGRETGWNDDGLADDVATLSYEQAIRTHGRTGNAKPGAQAPPLTPPALSETALGLHCDSADSFSTKPLKTASITIRLSGPECAQLRLRAAEAGLTLSAYLRSCTLEVESLRGQVKQMLAEVRSAASKLPVAEAAEESGRQKTNVLARIWQWFRQFGRKQKNAMSLNPANPFAPART